MIREGVGEEAEGILMKDDTTELRVDLVVEGSMEAPLRVQDRGDEVPMDHLLGRYCVSNSGAFQRWSISTVKIEVRHGVKRLG